MKLHIGILLLFFSPYISYSQISTTMYAGPNNNGTTIIEICMSITNTTNSDLTLFAGQEQIVVVQFGDAPINADFTADASCLRSDQFTVLDESINSLINSNSVSTARSDRQDFEVAFTFSADVVLSSGQTLELFCGQNTDIKGSCDDLVFLLDCSGTQFTIFNNRSIMPMGILDCTQGFAQQCDPNRPDAIILDFIKSDPTCFGSNDGNISAVVKGGRAPFAYEWSTGSVDVSISNLGPHIYSVTVTDSLECISTLSIELPSTIAIVLKFSSQYACEDEANGSVSVSVVSGGEPPFNYLWSNNADGQTTPTAIDLSFGSYEITVIDGNGCTVEGSTEIQNPPSDSILISCLEITNSSVIFGWSEDTTVDGYEVNINGQGWILPNQQLSHFLTGLDQGQIVDIEVRGIRDCLPLPIGSTSCTAFRFNSENSVYAPNVFSPNGDGINDRFVISVRPGVVILEMVIYERYGGVVFNQRNIQLRNRSSFWDGTKNGEPLNPQVLPYSLFVQFPDGREERLVGDVTIIR